jgi:integrase/recombinase XerD
MHEIMPQVVETTNSNQVPVGSVPPLCKDGSTIEELIESFLKAKFARTQSLKTARVYSETITTFRTMLQKQGMDLVMYTSDEISDYDVIRVRIAEAARDFAIRSRQANRPTVSTNTRNLRLAALSSFYDYAERNIKIPFANPIKIIERSPVEAYASAVALEEDDVREALRQIDTTTLLGKRDAALLQILFNTGRRASEVQHLTWGNMRIGRTGTVTLFFAHMKGGKSVSTPLDARVSALLLDYLHSYYGERLTRLDASAPLWVNMSEIPNDLQQEGAALGYQAIRKICQKHLGVTKVHITRHTFSHLMKEAGATIEERQEQLLHSSVATTQIYDKRLSRGKNKYAGTLATKLGL